MANYSVMSPSKWRKQQNVTYSECGKNENDHISENVCPIELKISEQAYMVMFYLGLEYKSIWSGSSNSCWMIEMNVSPAGTLHMFWGQCLDVHFSPPLLYNPP